MEEKQERVFRGIFIPAEIWLDDNLNIIDKAILFEIDSLDGENGCYSSNKYLANFCKCSERTVTRSISKLIDLGYIELENFNGRCRVLHSLVKMTILPRQNVYSPQTNCLPNNIINYNSNNKEENINISKDIFIKEEKKKSFKKPALEEVIEYCKERKNDIDPEYFYNYYESVNWMVGKNKMSNWKSAVITWERNKKEKEKNREKFKPKTADEKWEEVLSTLDNIED